MVLQRWATVFDSGPTLKHHWVDSCLSGEALTPYRLQRLFALHEEEEDDDAP